MAEQRDPDSDKLKVDAPGYEWHEIWLKVLANPSEASFNDILAAPGVSTKRALRWVFLANLAAVGIALAVFVIRSNQWGIIQFFPQIMIAVLLNGVVGVVGFVLTSLFLQGFARLGGGDGTFEEFHYVYAAFAAPLSIIGMLVALASSNFIFGIALSIYQLILTGMALRSVNNFTWGRTIVTMLAAFAVCGMIFVPIAAMLFAIVITGM